MTKLKQSIRWTAVLLYHRLKLAARRNHRYRLFSSAFSEGVIRKLACYFNQSIKEITVIVGKNGQNTKSIYKRAVIDSRYYKIEFYLCKKADNRIFDYREKTPIVADRLRSPRSTCAVDKHCQYVIPTTPLNNDTRMALYNNTIIKSEPPTKSINANIILSGPTTCNDLGSSSKSLFISPAVNHQCQSIKSFTPPCIDTHIAFNNGTSTSKKLLPPTKKKPNVNRRSSSRIATNNSLYYYKQWLNKPKYQELILIKDHATISNLPYVKLTEMKTEIGFHRPNYMTERKRIEQFLVTAGISNEIRHLHHLRDPHIMGVYGPFSDKMIQDNSLPPIKNAFVHSPSHPLLATSNNGIDLIFIPTIESASEGWKQCLSKNEVDVINGLKFACMDLESLLNFRLNEKYTIKSAIHALARKKDQYHHDVLHLRYCYHTISMCAEVHNFTSNLKHKIVKKGVIVQPGIVQMVRSNVAKNSPKEAFSKLIIPLTKIAEFYLLQLPKGLFDKKLPNAGSFFNNECSYLSLNIYFDDHSWQGCPSLYFSKKRKKWLPITNSHHGLYLHRDHNNWRFGVILIFGCDIDGFDQRYVTYALRLPCPGWSIVLGDFQHLLHAVSSGTAGLRFSLVVANHGSAVRGVDVHGKRVLLRNNNTYHL